MLYRHGMSDRNEQLRAFGTSVSTTSAGSLTFLSKLDGTNGHDLDLSYDIADEPSNTIYVLESMLSTSAAGVANSGTIHTILSPDGANPTEKLHHPSLYLETQLGTPIPNPAASSLLVIAVGIVLCRRCSSRIRRL